jgi:hypothetical protein
MSDRAEQLARRLRAAACLPGASAAPTAWPCDRALLDWLRWMTHAGLYTWDVEENLARRWIGGDIFNTRRPAAVPGFLAGVDLRDVPAHLVAPILRRLSLTRPAPAAEDLTPAALGGDAGRVSLHRRTGAARHWGQPGQAPPLPSTTAIPHVVHGIWLGCPLPATSGFWANYAAAADHYAGAVDFVLWTDIARERFDDSGALRDWALAHGIHVVNVAEVFHAAAPMRLHTPYTIELNQRTPQAFAAASDHLRIEVVHRFGGLYADGDLHFGPTGDGGAPAGGVGYQLFRGRWPGPPTKDGPATLPELFDRVADSTPGFTLHTLADDLVLNDVLAAPAGHPALALWMEGARYNYLRDQRHLFVEPSDVDTPGEPASWTWAVTPVRTGRVHHWLLKALGLTGADLVPAAPAIRGYSELSWLPPVGGTPAVMCADPDPLRTLIACLDQLRWQHRSRTGDLALTTVAHLIRGLPDPDTGWTALLLAFRDLSFDLGPVMSVTDRRRNQDGSLDVVQLPPQAEALLRRTAGDDELWFLGERTAAARLR